MTVTHTVGKDHQCCKCSSPYLFYLLYYCKVAVSCSAAQCTTSLKNGTCDLEALLSEMTPFAPPPSNGVVLGRCLVPIRVCTSPGRDRSIDEKKVSKEEEETMAAESRQSRKRGEHCLSGCVKPCSLVDIVLLKLPACVGCKLSLLK